MSVFTGPITTLLAVGTPATSATALTAFKAKGNSCNLEVTTVTGGAGTLTITAKVGFDIAGTVTYYDVIDRDSTWSMTSSVINTAGTYNLPLEGLALTPGMYVKLYYACTNAAGTIAIKGINWENPKGGGVDVSVGDVVVDVGNIDVNIANVEQVHDAAVGASGFMQVVEAKTVDGSALPNAVSEGDVVRPAAEKTGNLLVTSVDADGSDTSVITHDVAIASGIGTAVDMVGAEAETLAALSTVNADGDATRLKASTSGVLHTDLTDPTGASDLGTAIATSLALLDDAIKTDDAVFTPATDKVSMIGCEFDDTAPDSVDEGDAGAVRMSANRNLYTNIRSGNGDEYGAIVDDHGCLWTLPQLSSVIDACNATTGWSVLSDDTDNLTTATNHVYGTASLSFDKVDGAGNTIFAGIQRTISSTDVEPYMEHARGFFLGSMYLSSLTDVAYVWFRAGTDSSNYNEWRIDDDNLVAGQWMALRGSLSEPYASTGNGWDSSAVTWIAIGVAFDAQDDTLASILVDSIMVNSGLQVSADLQASDINTPNINLHRVGGQPVDTGAGNVGNATQRVTIATNDANLAAINASAAIMDDWDETDRCKVNPIAGQAGVAAGSGAVDALTQRVILATDDPAVTLLGTIDADTSTIAGDTTSIDSKTPALGSAAMAASQPVTLATDDTQFGAVGAAADVDGNLHGQLRYIGESIVSSPNTPTSTNGYATGSAAIAFTTTIANNFELLSITLHLSAAGTTSENFTIGKDAALGSAYDTNLLTSDLSVGSVTDIALTPLSDDLPQYWKTGDELVFAWPNSEGRTYGLEVQYRVL